MFHIWNITIVLCVTKILRESHVGNHGYGPSRTFSDLPPSLIVAVTRKRRVLLSHYFLAIAHLFWNWSCLSVLCLLRLYAAVLFIRSGDLAIHAGRRSNWSRQARSTTASANRQQSQWFGILRHLQLRVSWSEHHFSRKKPPSRLEYANISGNCEKTTILAVACLCSYENVQTIVAHGYRFSTDELLFLCRVNFTCVQTWI